MKLQSFFESAYVLVSILVLPLQISLTGLTTKYCVSTGPTVKHLLILAPPGQEQSMGWSSSTPLDAEAEKQWLEVWSSSPGAGCVRRLHRTWGVLQQPDTSDAVRPTLLVSNNSLLYSLL